MKKIIFTFTVFVLLYNEIGWTSGAFTTAPPNAGVSALGYAYTASKGEPQVIEHNPAGLASMSGLQMTFSYRDYYSLGLIGHSYAALGLEVSDKIGVGFSFNRVGATRDIDFMDYNEDIFSLGVGKRLEFIQGLKTGAVFSFYNVSSEENASGYGLSCGLLWSPERLEGVNLGMSIRNLNNPRISWTTGAEDSITPVLSVGGSYEHESGLKALTSYDGTISAGLEYEFLEDMFALRAGYRDMEDFTGTVSAGLSAAYGRFRLDYAAENHRALGLSHFFTVNVSVD